ncbi:MAG: DUF1836 domain-containing protein [Bacillota bacterium]|nr:DUF1836 domain-containing protein [Bacillota bacterium]MDP4170897.1 DUF1836 domain-containing protein [Bacillota bacterium]
MSGLNKQISELGVGSQLTLDDIPNIDLYMDQVIQLFENQFSGTKRNEQDKVLTKTMINNYAKGKLLFPIKNKKYSKQHLILISLIYQLKGALSINDIKDLLEKLNEKTDEGEFDLETFYTSYLHLSQKNGERFIEDSQIREREAKEEIKLLKDKNSAYLERALLISSFVDISNLYRRAAEKLLDGMVSEKEH